MQYNDRSPMENYHAAATWMKLREEPHNFLKKLPAKVGSQGGLEVRVCCYEHLEPPPPLDPPLPAQAVKPSYSPHPHLTGTGVPAQAGHRHDPVHRHEAGGGWMGRWGVYIWAGGVCMGSLTVGGRRAGGRSTILA